MTVLLTEFFGRMAASQQLGVNVSSYDLTTGCYSTGTGSLLSWCTVGIHSYTDLTTHQSQCQCTELQVIEGEWWRRGVSDSAADCIGLAASTSH